MLNETLNPITIQSALSSSPASTTSSKYKFFDSKILASSLLQKGWRVHIETEAHVLKESKKGFQRHMIVFKNPEYSSVEGDLQIVLRNAHDSSCAVEIFTGFMRIACANQLFSRNLGTGSLIKVRHTGEDMQDKVLKGFQGMIDFLPTYHTLINQLKNRILSHIEMNEFARRAVQIRFREKDPNTFKVNLDEVLKSERDQDDLDCAWNVFNRTQEKLLGRGLQYSILGKDGKWRITTTRKIKSMNTLPEINDELMDLILEISEVG
jgi:hypothetical protein